MNKPNKKYEVVHEIGSGPSGKVQKVNYQGKIYALKTIKIANEDRNKLFKQTQQYKNLEQQNIIKVQDASLQFKERYLTIFSKFYPDGNLNSVIKNVTDQRLIMKYIAHLAIGLNYLHQKNMVHGNLKPENVLLQGQTAKIIDYGLSAKLNSSTFTSQTANSKYRPPEHFLKQEKQFSPQGDIWSLGILCLQMLTGKRIDQLLEGPEPPGLRKNFPSLELIKKVKNRSTRALVRDMLVRDPKDRICCREVIQWLFPSHLEQPQLLKPKKLDTEQLKPDTIEDSGLVALDWCDVTDSRHKDLTFQGSIIANKPPSSSQSKQPKGSKQKQSQAIWVYGRKEITCGSVGDRQVTITVKWEEWKSGGYLGIWDRKNNKPIGYRNNGFCWQGEKGTLGNGIGFKLSEPVTMSVNMNSGVVEWRVASELRHEVKSDLLKDWSRKWRLFIGLCHRGDRVRILE